MTKSRLHENFLSTLKTLNQHSDYKWKAVGDEIIMLNVPNGYRIDLLSNWRRNSNIHIRVFGNNGWAITLKTVKYNNCINLEPTFTNILDEFYQRALISPPIIKKQSDVDKTIDLLSMFDKHDRPKGHISKEMIKEVVEHDTLTYWSGSDEDEPIITIYTKGGEGQ